VSQPFPLPPPLILYPKLLGSLDIRVLPSLHSAGQQDHQIVAVAAKVEPISWPPIDAALLHTGADALDIREIAKAKAFDGDGDFRSRWPIKAGLFSSADIEGRLGIPGGENV
jgi:hypothetical protein